MDFFKNDGWMVAIIIICLCTMLSSTLYFNYKFATISKMEKKRKDLSFVNEFIKDPSTF